MPGTTPVYGFPYPEPTDLVADYPALGQQLAEDIEDVLPTIGGLAPATPTSIANSGGTATLSGNTVTFSGVSSVSLNGCFTGDYDNYLLTYNGTASTGTTLAIRLRTGTTNAATDYENTGITVSDTGTVAGQNNSAFTTYVFGPYIGGDGEGGWGINIYQPFLAQYTSFNFSGPQSYIVAGTSYAEHNTSRHRAATSYESVHVFPVTGTITGTLRVYGYRN